MVQRELRRTKRLPGFYEHGSPRNVPNIVLRKNDF